MKLNPKVTGALAWTGLVLVLAVPAAEMLGGKPEAKATLTSDMDQVQTASVKPAAIKPAATQSAAVKPVVGDDPVQEFVKSGKKLPSYISGGDAPAQQTASVPQPTVKKPGTITVNSDGTIDKPYLSSSPAPVVASVPRPALIAPVPLPASARPATRPATATEAPLIIDESQVATADPDVFIPPEPIVSGDQLEEWDTGSLAQYLERRGILEKTSQAAPARGEYDPDGFFLSDGPNRPRNSRVIIIDRAPDYWN